MSSLRPTVLQPTTASATRRKPPSVSHAPTRGTRVRPAKPTPTTSEGHLPNELERCPSRWKASSGGRAWSCAGAAKPPRQQSGVDLTVHLSHVTLHVDPEAERGLASLGRWRSRTHGPVSRDVVDLPARVTQTGRQGLDGAVRPQPLAHRTGLLLGAWHQDLPAVQCARLPPGQLDRSPGSTR
jgi:hypothetical protein